jgi:hypothetical protein
MAVTCWRYHSSTTATGWGSQSTPPGVAANAALTRIKLPPPHTGEANGIRQRTFGQVRTIQWDNESMKHDQASVCERRR